MFRMSNVTANKQKMAGQVTNRKRNANSENMGQTMHNYKGL